MAQSTDSATRCALQTYWEIAREPCKRSALVEDKTCIQFLAYVLADREPSIVMTSLQILKLLSLKSAHRAAIREVFGVLEAVESLVDGDERKEIAILASEVLHILMRIPRYNISKPSKDSLSGDRPLQGLPNAKPVAKCPLKTTVLSVTGINTPDDRWQCEEQLIKVKGVLSITFDGNRKLCIITSREDTNSIEFVRAISLTRKVTARILESRSSAKSGQLARADKENSEMPQYLPEQTTYEIDEDRAIAAEDAAKNGTSTWWNSAATFISKSFYW